MAAILSDTFAATEYLNSRKTTVVFIERELMDVFVSAQKPPFIVAICHQSSVRVIKTFLFKGINDFLFLPITESSVRTVVGKIINIYNACAHTEHPIASESLVPYGASPLSKSTITQDSIFFNGGRNTESIRILFNDVLYIKNIGSKVVIYQEDGNTKYINTSLKKLYMRLPNGQFQKINRAVIININKVSKIIRNNKIIIANETFSISRSFIKEFKEMLQ